MLMQSTTRFIMPSKTLENKWHIFFACPVMPFLRSLRSIFKDYECENQVSVVRARKSRIGKTLVCSLKRLNASALPFGQCCHSPILFNCHSHDFPVCTTTKKKNELGIETFNFINSKQFQLINKLHHLNMIEILGWREKNHLCG